MSMRWTVGIALIAAAGLTLAQAGCESMTRAQRGAVIGGISGAAAGGLIGSKRGRTSRGAIIGGVLGAVTGGVIGNYMDEQARELAKVAEVKRVEDGIVVTMRDKILFDFDQATLKPESKTSLQKIAEVIQKYHKTEVAIAGYTDNVGKVSYNQQLSERRANAVRLFLIDQGVRADRLTVMGFGPDNPITSNATPEGRAQNRRVELHISPDAQLVRDAEAAG